MATTTDPVTGLPVNTPVDPTAPVTPAVAATPATGAAPLTTPTTANGVAGAASAIAPATPAITTMPVSAPATVPAVPVASPTQTPAPTTPAPQPQSVQDQVSGMIDPNNPFFQKWATVGKETAAANGFTNGSMQQTGIINSVLQNATPIATANYQGQVAQADTATSTQSQQLIAQTQQQNAVLLQNSKAATDAFAQFQTALFNIDSNTSMDTAAKAAAIGNQQDVFNNAISKIKSAQGTGAVPDVSGILNVGNVKANNDANAVSTAVANGGYIDPNGQLWSSQTAYATSPGAPNPGIGTPNYAAWLQNNPPPAPVDGGNNGG